MGIIKAESAPLSMTSFSMRDIEAQARAILSRARQHADALLAAAQAEGEQLKLAAHAEGHAEGRARGLAEGLEEGRGTGRDEALAAHGEELRQTLAAVAGAAAALEEHRNELETAALQEVVGLAIAVARRVTKRQGLLDAEVLGANLTDAMRLVVQAADVRIAVNPAQRQTLDEVIPRLSVEWPSLKHVEVVEDSAISPGGCRVHTRQGQIDADLDVQLDRVVAELLPTPG